MKLKPTPLQTRILVRVGRSREIPMERLTRSLMTAKEVRKMARPERESEIRLNLDLLSVYGVVSIVDRSGSQVCVAQDRLVAWAAARDARNRPALAARSLSPIAPIMATALLAASAGCGTLKDWTQPTPAPVVKAYADGSRAPERMEQFYNPRTGNLVYRFCVGDECPGPTPKKPARTMSVVTEVHPDGMGEPVPQNPQGGDVRSTRSPATSGEAYAGGRTPVAPITKPSPAAASVVAQLESKRRALQADAAGEREPDRKRTANPPELSVKPDLVTPAVGPRPDPAIKDPFVPPPTPGASTAGANSGVKPASPTPPLSRMDSPEGAPTEVQALQDFVSNWARLWSTKDSDAYFALYAREFAPSYGETTRAGVWAQQRRAIMSRPGSLKVAVNIVRTETNGDQASIRFWQTYESPTFKSRVMKRIDLVRAGDDWKIRRERLIPVGERVGVA